MPLSIIILFFRPLFIPYFQSESEILKAEQ